MIQIGFLLLFSIVFAENYAVIYGTIESFTYTELPSSPCRVYSYLFTLGFQADNVVYMLDTTDYDMNWDSSYKNWYSGENYYLRDQFFSFSCSGIDFAGTYVDPMFLIHYLKNDYDYIKEKSGLDDFKKLTFNKDDRIVVFFMDTHGRGSQFYPDRILTPTVVSKTFDYMAEKRMYKSMVWFVEATYADWAFANAEKRKEVLVLTIKDEPVGGRFIHIYEKDEKKMKYIEGVWENSWITLLPFSCAHSVKYLMQMGIAASIQQHEKLSSPVIWGDRRLLKLPVSHFFGVKECPGVYDLHQAETSPDLIRNAISSVISDNFNQTVPFQYNRQVFQKYSRYMESIVKKAFMSELTEASGISLPIVSCVFQLQDSLLSSCKGYMPLADPYLSYFLKLCQNRKHDGYYTIDFSPFCTE